ncbi:unnamed protein product [Absidia cylindrospora]
MNKQDATTERIAAARREAELLKERIKQRREALSDTTLPKMAKGVEPLPRLVMKFVAIYVVILPRFMQCTGRMMGNTWFLLHKTVN